MRVLFLQGTSITDSINSSCCDNPHTLPPSHPILLYYSHFWVQMCWSIRPMCIYMVYTWFLRLKFSNKVLGYIAFGMMKVLSCSSCFICFKFFTKLTDMDCFPSNFLSNTCNFLFSLSNLNPLRTRIFTYEGSFLAGNLHNRLH